jgi:hypothetical protein
MWSSIVVWLVILALLIVSFLTDKIPFWAPVVLYIVSVFVRTKEIVGNYSDTEKKSARDEKLQLERKTEEMAERGLIFSGIRKQEEQRIREDFEFEKRKRRRKLWVDLMNSLFLK